MAATADAKSGVPPKVRPAAVVAKHAGVQSRPVAVGAAAAAAAAGVDSSDSAGKWSPKLGELLWTYRAAPGPGFGVKRGCKPEVFFGALESAQMPDVMAHSACLARTVEGGEFEVRVFQMSEADAVKALTLSKGSDDRFVMHSKALKTVVENFVFLAFYWADDVHGTPDDNADTHMMTIAKPKPQVPSAVPATSSVPVSATDNPTLPP